MSGPGPSSPVTPVGCLPSPAPKPALKPEVTSLSQQQVATCWLADYTGVSMSLWEGPIFWTRLHLPCLSTLPRSRRPRARLLKARLPGQSNTFNQTMVRAHRSPGTEGKSWGRPGTLHFAFNNPIAGLHSQPGQLWVEGLGPWGQLGRGGGGGGAFRRDTVVVLVNGERLWGKARTATLTPWTCWLCYFRVRELKDDCTLCILKGRSE